MLLENRHRRVRRAACDYVQAPEHRVRTGTSSRRMTRCNSMQGLRLVGTARHRHSIASMHIPLAQQLRQLERKMSRWLGEMPCRSVAGMEPQRHKFGCVQTGVAHAGAHAEGRFACLRRADPCSMFCNVLGRCCQQVFQFCDNNVHTRHFRSLVGLIGRCICGKQIQRRLRKAWWQECTASTITRAPSSVASSLFINEIFQGGFLEQRQELLALLTQVQVLQILLLVLLLHEYHYYCCCCYYCYCCYCCYCCC